MNERIKQLAEQAGFPDWWIKPLEPERQNGESEKMIEKFAELIVRECAFEAFKFWLAQDDCNEESAQAHIKQHFGVE